MFRRRTCTWVQTTRSFSCRSTSATDTRCALHVFVIRIAAGTPPCTPVCRTVTMTGMRRRAHFAMSIASTYVQIRPRFCIPELDRAVRTDLICASAGGFIYLCHVLHMLINKFWQNLNAQIKSACTTIKDVTYIVFQITRH